FGVPRFAPVGLSLRPRSSRTRASRPTAHMDLAHWPGPRVPRGFPPFARSTRMDGAAWHPVTAYLYVLHLDGPSLAWEYLRRNPEYRRDWHEHWRRPRQAQRWGLRLLENPDL